MLIARTPDALAAGSGSAILACECREGARVPSHRWLSIRTMLRGRELHGIAQGCLLLDEDAWLIANPERTACSVYRGAGAIRPLVVYFDSGTVHRARERAGAGDTPFLECLRPHGDAVSRRLLAIAARIETAPADTRWFEVQTALLLEEAIEAEHRLRRRAQRIECVKPATREELFRRVLLAADFMHSHYEQPITLDDIAAAARLSRFHLCRLFHRTHGVTPHAYLRAKRLAVANRMLGETRRDLCEIAECCGFGSRSSLFRHLHKQCGASGQRLRGQAARTPAENAEALLVEPCPIAA